MELRHLRRFLAVADSLSFTRPATGLRRRQPTLSHQIGETEQEVGTELSDRLGRKVRLNAPRVIYWEHAGSAFRVMIRKAHSGGRTR